MRLERGSRGAERAKLVLLLCAEIGWVGGGPASVGAQEPVAMIPFEVFRGEILMEGTIRGRAVRIAVDNGVLWDDLLFFGSPRVDSLDFTYTDETTVSGSGSGAAAEARRATGVTLSLGDAHFNDQSAVVTGYEPGAPNLWEGIDGQVSAALFRAWVVRVDFVRRQIELYPLDEPRPTSLVELPLTAQGSGMWTVPARLTMPGATPVAVSLALDIGNSNALRIAADGPHQIGPPPSATPASLGFGIQGEVLGWFGLVEHVDLGGVELGPILTAFEEELAFEAMQLGFEILSRFHVVFDYPRGVLGLTPNEYLERPHELWTGGVFLQDDGRGARVSGVSESYDGPFREGDRVVEVGEVDASRLGAVEVAAAVAESPEESVLVVVDRSGRRIASTLPVAPARFFVRDRASAPPPTRREP